MIFDRFENVIVVKTNDYARVIRKILKDVQNYNINNNATYKTKVYSHAIESFEGIKFQKDDLIRAIKSNEETVFVFRNFNPFSDDEIIHFQEKYAIKNKCPTKIVIIADNIEISNAIKPYVKIIEDYYPSKDEVPETYQFIPGLTLHEIIKANENDKIEEYRKKIIKDTDGILEIIKYNEIDNPIGLENTIDMIIKLHQSKMGKGVLLVGVPGTGKTLLAKYLSKDFPVIKFNFGLVYNKYVGETEARLKRVLDKIEKFDNCFLFIDEFEKAIANGNGDSGVSKRVLGMFLSWLQDRRANVYAIATMNDISHLPLELIRPGRWDMILGLLPPGKSLRKKISEYYANKYGCNIIKRVENIEDITPADIENYYRLYSILGEQAHRIVKFTKDIMPEKIKLIKEFVKKYAVPVYQEDDNLDYV